jgi:hypothetical protein
MHRSGRAGAWDVSCDAIDTRAGPVCTLWRVATGPARNTPRAYSRRRAKGVEAEIPAVFGFHHGDFEFQCATL